MGERDARRMRVCMLERERERERDVLEIVSKIKQAEEKYLLQMVVSKKMTGTTVFALFFA
jgi:hypothetical protein